MLLTGKVATAYAASLGTMVTGRSMPSPCCAVPVDYLVLPGVGHVGCRGAMPTVLWHWLRWHAQHRCSTVPPPVFWARHLDASDVPSMLLKATVFGLEIAIIACGWGLTTRGGPKEVGTSTTGAVVMILLIIAITDVILTQLLYG